MGKRYARVVGSPVHRDEVAVIAEDVAMAGEIE